MGLELRARIRGLSALGDERSQNRHRGEKAGVFALAFETGTQGAGELVLLTLDTLDQSLAVSLLDRIEAIHTVDDLDGRESDEEQDQDDVAQRLHGSREPDGERSRGLSGSQN